MSYVTVEVDIDHGQVVPREPGKLPEKGRGLLTILQPAQAPVTNRRRVKLPLIKSSSKRLINPTPEELDASLWS